MKNLFLLLALLCAGAAHAANNGVATASWVAVTKNTDGSTITGAVTYNVFIGTQGQANKPLVATGITGLSYQATGLATGADVCFQISVSVVGEFDSALSNEACKTAANPTTVTVASNVFQLQKKRLVLVGQMALKVPCGPDAHCKSPFSGAELFDVPRNKVSFTGKDNGTQTFGVCA